MRDQIYEAPRNPVSEFVFDERVAQVFPDMINRSVPGYATLIDMIGVLGAQYAQPGSHCYDLGCSLGAAALAMARSIDRPDCRVIGIDSSAAMIDAGRRHIAALRPRLPVELVCGDLQETQIAKASVVVLNLTLQFIDPAGRQRLLLRIFNGLLPGGALILSEKIAFESPTETQCLSDLHEAFKKANGYSELEIAQKRSALEKVLIPEALEVHRERLGSAGFRNCTLWFQCFNFVSVVCIKK
jgi:tRNA (cmo5U34)-methyltransferase